MFMLNLLFDFNDTTGSFSNLETPGTQLLNSKHWLKVAAPDGAGADPENSAHWEDLQRAGTLLIPHGGVAANTHHIAMRVAPIPAVAIDPNSTLDIVVAFGRPAIARQQFASPFVIGGATITMFSGSGLVRAAGATGWFFRLRRLDRQPGHPNLTFRYEFAVGVTVVDAASGDRRTYGEDPEFDVGT